MSVSTSQYELLLARMSACENALNNALVAINNLASKSSVVQLLAVIQHDLADTRASVEALEIRVASIEEEPLE